MQIKWFNLKNQLACIIYPFSDLRKMKQIELSTLLDLDTLLPVCTRRMVVDDDDDEEEDDDDISYDEYAEYVRSFIRPELGKSN
ncbi:hypothetical protein OROMI_000511 [Orobanche minor]